MQPSLILLAVSGGLDSMVMLHRMHAEYGAEQIRVAHCNFMLRDEESDGDEELVKSVCARMNVSCDVKRFETRAFASSQGLSIQEAARELRYAFFFELMNTHGCTHLATAHHQDDSVETFFINLIRGSGPRGLAGIKEDEERAIIRPLMNMNRTSILAYANENNISWREDSSNAKSDYLRNKIRHELIPKLSGWKPSFHSVMMRNMEIQKDLDSLLKTSSEAYRKSHFHKDGESTRISPDGSEHEGLFLRTLLTPYGFNDAQLTAMLNSSQSGKQVYSSDHVLTSHRGGFLLDAIQEYPDGTWEIDEELNSNEMPFPIHFEFHFAPPENFDPDPKIAFLDASRLTFPLTLRPWKDGDKFKPLGMKGKKLISDFLIDEKVSLEEKKRTLVLLSDEKIVWLVGRRISEDFKCLPSTNRIIQLSFNQSQYQASKTYDPGF